MVHNCKLLYIINNLVLLAELVGTGVSYMSKRCGANVLKLYLYFLLFL